ncbi:hypothetical protein GCM10009730_60960 [Streptomyces albidochromogenes]
MRVTCEPCAYFAKKRGARAVPSPACGRCRRAGLPLAGGYCCGCRWHVANYGPGDFARFGTQLWFGPPVPAPTSLRPSEVSPRASRRPVSEHVATPGQERLVELRRDWRPVVELARQELPTLTDSATRLLADLDSVMKKEMWSTVPVTKTPANATNRSTNASNAATAFTPSHETSSSAAARSTASHTPRKSMNFSSQPSTDPP